jgi:TetR/AcrR family acrAB operon transcriptional repressor
MTATPETTAKRRIDEIGDESRRRILDAAEELFAEKGFEKTSFVDIAARSGISRGSIPWHFKNKDGLLIAVVDRANQRYLSLDQFSERPTLGEILARYELLARDTRSRLVFSVLNEAMSSSNEVRDEYRAHYAEQRRRVAHWLKVMGVHTPAARESLATAIVGSIIGTTMQWQLDPDNVDLGATFKALAKLVESHLPS